LIELTCRDSSIKIHRIRAKWRAGMFRWACGTALGWSVLGGFALMAHADTPASSHLAIQVGLTPEALAASSVTSAEAGALLARLDAATEQVAAFNAATLSLDTAINNLLAMDQILIADPDDEETATARDALATLRAQASSAKSALIAAGLQGLQAEAKSRVERFMAAAGSTLPAALKVCPLSVPERRALEAALTAEQRADRLDLTLPSGTVSVLSACRSHADVVAAGISLSANLATIQAVYAIEGGQ
jgi:hypothetical protein